MLALLRTRHPSLASIVIVLAIVASCTGEQRPKDTVELTTLGGSVVEHPVPFTFIAGAQELRDGRVVIADPREQAIRLVDFGSGAAERVGRDGRGPGEYQGPREVLRWRGDTLLVYDVGNRRLHKVDENGRLAGHIDMPPGLTTGRVLAPPAGADDAGHVYMQVELIRLPRDTVLQERRGILYRWHPDDNRLDSIASLMTREPERQELLVAYFPKQDGWAVLRDGRVGIVRAAEYRVVWFLPRGDTVRGPAIAYDPLPLTDEERAAHAEGMTGAASGARMTGPAQSGGAMVRLPQEERYPATKPPFEARGRQGELGVRSSPEQELWVTRSRAWKDSVSAMDVFDAAGRRVRVVTLPPHTRLVGFGQEVVYLARKDADDLEWLQRISLR